MKESALKFIDACETGKGWAVCAEYCHPDATFSAQAEPLAEIDTVEGYVEWMKGMLGLMPDGSYELKSFAVDEERQSVCAYAIFRGTHTGEGGPVAPTGRKTESDYVYVLNFEDGRIRRLTKIWNAPFAMKQLGWG